MLRFVRASPADVHVMSFGIKCLCAAAIKSPVYAHGNHTFNTQPDTREAGERTFAQLGIPIDVYLDPQTKLMWTVEDNGRSVKWAEADRYARELRLQGYSDWSLPGWGAASAFLSMAPSMCGSTKTGVPLGSTPGC